MKLIKWFAGSLTTALMLVSCVTINIYFPAAAAEKAADSIIEDVLGGQTSDEDNSETKQPEQQSLLKLKTQRLAINILDVLVPPAQAQEVNIEISSPSIKQIQARMKTRTKALRPYYDSGAVGFTNKGLITVRDAKAIALKDRNKVKSLVVDENKDRNALYAEIARANGHPEWQADIQATFAKGWANKISKGWWYQTDSGWKQK